MTAQSPSVIPAKERHPVPRYGAGIQSPLPGGVQTGERVRVRVFSGVDPSALSPPTLPVIPAKAGIQPYRGAAIRHGGQDNAP